jgi:hypothetical protein
MYLIQDMVYSVYVCVYTYVLTRKITGKTSTEIETPDEHLLTMEHSNFNWKTETLIHKYFMC